MASLVDIFNPSFFMFLGILVLVAALLVVYFESKMREQNHKMASMLNLITCMADETNAIKIHLSQQTASFGIGGTGLQHHPSSLETNDIHIVKTDLIPVSDDSDSDSDNDSENSIEDNESDSGSDSGSESISEDIEEVKNIIEIGETPDIKVLKLNLSNINDIDIDDSKNVNDFEEIGDLEFIDGDDNLSVDSDSLSVSSDDNENENENKNDDIDISKLNLKSINISSLEEVKNSNNVDYKKLTLNKLRSIVVEKELVADSSKLKKNELLKLLGAE
jgi:hypothetical protein